MDTRKNPAKCSEFEGLLLGRVTRLVEYSPIEGDFYFSGLKIKKVELIFLLLFPWY
jgi:hypothetical protein